eukprot:Lithocolla_globosa_v1_NODE_1195_length_2795_cov_83.101095.p1 type:complete len:873 gc:universal NODE_1195_length_2795_cov_83.101095:2725-107(-)
MNHKKDDDTESSPFIGLNKSTVLQETRLFHDPQLNIAKCSALLTKILYLINQGEVIATTEATELFFAITKLFQNKDPSLRRLVYIMIKELADISEDVIIVTSSLQKDTIDRANSIRALCRITDSSLISSSERFLKQAIVDKNPHVSSAALVSAIHFHNANKDTVKRWANEVADVTERGHVMNQYHAVGLLYAIRQKDRMAINKLVRKHNQVRSPYAQCMIIRYTIKAIQDEDSDVVPRDLYEQLDMLLHHKSDMVTFEAARALCSLPGITSAQISPAVSALQIFLNCDKPLMKFAAIRTLNKVAITHPVIVSASNLDMENLITDANRSIATYAITTLLKTGNEASVDRLMKQIGGFMSEISDEFKVVVIEAIRTLCIKFPSKQTAMLNFLAAGLRRPDEGGYEYKKALVDTLITFTSELPETKEFGLTQLCEFVEDCEYTNLAVRILSVLGREGPSCSQPSRYIRCIYNRVILENAAIRGAAVTALAKFGLQLEKERPSILVILQRILNDTDDEVRDRATMYNYLLINDLNLAASYLMSDDTYNMPVLETALKSYLDNPSHHEAAFYPAPGMMKQVTLEPTPIPTVAAEEPLVPTAKNDKNQNVEFVELMSSIPELSALPMYAKSCKSIALTESDTEYLVRITKHIFQEHIVLQFWCKNTLNDQILENVSVSLELPDEMEGILTEEKILPIPSLVYDQPQSIFIILKKTESDSFPVGSISCTLKFIVKDCDPETLTPDEEGYDDEYSLEYFEINVADYVVPQYIHFFKPEWEKLQSNGVEVSETYELSSMQSLEMAVTKTIEFLGMFPCEKSEKVEHQTVHELMLSCNFPGTKVLTLAKCNMIYQQDSGVTMKITVRSDSEIHAQLIADAVV